MLSPDRSCLEPSPRPLPHLSPDFSAVYRRGMASQARADVNLDDGAVVGGSRRQAVPDQIFREESVDGNKIPSPSQISQFYSFKEYGRPAKSGYGMCGARQIRLAAGRPGRVRLQFYP